VADGVILLLVQARDGLHEKDKDGFSTAADAPQYISSNSWFSHWAYKNPPVGWATGVKDQTVRRSHRHEEEYLVSGLRRNDISEEEYEIAIRRGGLRSETRNDVPKYELSGEGFQVRRRRAPDSTLSERFAGARGLLSPPKV